MKLRPETIKFKLGAAFKPQKSWKTKAEWNTGRRKDTDPWSYCRDFKKEGLTKPRILIRIMLEELRDRLPWTTCFRETAFFAVQ